MFWSTLRLTISAIGRQCNTVNYATRRLTVAPFTPKLLIAAHLCRLLVQRLIWWECSKQSLDLEQLLCLLYIGCSPQLHLRPSLCIEICIRIMRLNLYKVDLRAYHFTVPVSGFFSASRQGMGIGLRRATVC